MSTPTRWKKTLPVLAVLLFAGTAGGAIVYFIKSMLDAKPQTMKQIVQQVQIVRPPPPPEVEPPPPEIEEEVDVPEPEPQPQEPDSQPPPGDQLGLDADGSAGGDGFGLMARKGGRDLLAGGGGFGWYTGLLKNAVLERLQDNKQVRAGSYSIVVRLWLKPDGSVEKVTLADSTGDRELDRAIEAALSGLQRVAQAPPLEMPQPVSLKIVSRI